jgi:8-oxo-dGTP diphosphatase
MTRRTASPDIRAAGGVVWRVVHGHIEIAVVHRARYDDWSLPKGKCEPDESELAAAAREVREEIGAHVAVSRRLGTITYPVDAGTKSVTYWAMRHVQGEFASSDEVDEIAWLPPGAALERLSYRADRRIVNEVAGLPVPDSVVVLLRHAKAGKRSEWRGDDRERPLDVVGEAQAGRLAGLLALFRPDRIHAGDLTRCTQTVRPLAELLGLDVQVDHLFTDDAFESAPTATEDAILALAKPGRVSVVCSQGTAIPELVERLVRGVVPTETRKAAFWVLAVVDGNVISADYYEDALR